MRIAFAALALSLVGLLGLTVYRDDSAEWKSYQREFYELLAQRQVDPAKAAAIRSTEPAIKQLYNPEIAVIDRCPTCHLGIDDPAFDSERQPFRAHPGPYLSKHPPDRVGCVICHDGQGLATTTMAAHGRVPHWDRPLLDGKAREAACARCHSGDDVPKARVLSAGMRLIERAACVACHDISEVPAPDRPEGPNLSHVGDKVDPEWLFDWLANPQGYLARTMMPNFRLSPADAAAISAYLLTLRGGTLDAPPRAVSESESRGVIERGKALFNRSACQSCHPFDGKGGYDGRLGPDLGRVGHKVSRQWLATWLKDPLRLQPHSRMAAYTFGDEDLRSLVEYVLRTSARPKDRKPRPELQQAIGSKSALEHGRSLVMGLGCLGCHRVDGLDTPPKVGPDLSRVGEKRAEELDFGGLAGPRTLAHYLRMKILDPRAAGARLKMPYFAFTDEETEAITVALLSFARSAMPRHYRAPVEPFAGPRLPEGRAGRVVRRYECITCHALSGRGGTMAPDLADEGVKVKRTWLDRYLANPYPIRLDIKERMPALGMRSAEIETLVDWITVACVADRVASDPFGGKPPPRELVEKGRQLFKKNECDECHGQAKEEGPDLSHAGSRLEPGWIFSFIQDPEAFIPRTFMPNRHITPEDALAITAYLAAQM